MVLLDDVDGVGVALEDDEADTVHNSSDDISRLVVDSLDRTFIVIQKGDQMVDALGGQLTAVER